MSSTEIHYLEGRIEEVYQTLKGQIADLKMDLSVDEGDVTILQAQVDSLANKLSDLKQRMDLIQWGKS